MKLNEIISQPNKPDILYHYTWPEHRDSILQQGLLVGKSQTEGSEIYLASKLRLENNGDIWQVDARGLAIEPDFVTPEDEEDTWWVIYDSIPPARLRLIKAA